MRSFQVLLCLAALLLAAQSYPYSQEQSINVLYYARVAQCGSDKILTWECTPCKFHPEVTDIQVFNNNSMQIQAVTFYDQQNKVIVAAFRGTHGTLNWIYNFDAFQVPYPECSDCKVHLGFYTDYLAVRTEVLEAVSLLTQKYPDHQRIISTGHSLGAVLATLAAVDLEILYPGKQDIFYNFGSPRVGNLAFAQHFNKLHPTANRVVHYHDPVPHVPFQWEGYVHVAREVFYTDQDSSHYEICDASGEDPKCSDSVSWRQYIPEDHMYYMQVFCDC